MIPAFENSTKLHPHDPLFLFVEDDGRVIGFSYEEVRSRAAALAFLLQEKGVGRGSHVSVDMANCPAYIFLIFAAAYGGFTLVALNHRLTEEEKAERLVDLKMMREMTVATHLTEQSIEHLLAKATFLDAEEQTGKAGFFRKKKAEQPQGKLDPTEVFHWLERGTAFFDGSMRALVMFTSGTAGRPKAVPLTWENLCGAAEASNIVLNTSGQGMWQAALPLFHIGGFQIVVRSVLNATPFILYRSFDADRVLGDVAERGASHISVVDKMLQDMLASEQAGLLERYRCILLGGAAPNPATLGQAVEQGARVYASYGMTETSSQIASSLATESYDGTCMLLPGYEAQIIAPDEKGIGQLAVKGPGVFFDYLNARAAFTVDGFFLTGDTASMFKRQIKVQERVNDMFVSGGENVYPAEIRDKLMRIPGVSDAYVFGVEDETWGRRPVALVERSWQVVDVAHEEAPAKLSPQLFAAEVSKSLEQRLAKIYRPRHICVMESFPRTGIGKIDREALERSYAERLEIREVRIHHIKQKFKTPIATAKTNLRTRQSVIIEVEDWAGRIGIGECVAFATDWYLPETLADDVCILEENLIPLVLDQIYLHPSEVSASFGECIAATAFPLAKGALEPAFWDLYGKIVGKPLWQLIGGTTDKAIHARPASHEKQATHAASTVEAEVPAGAVIGIMSSAKTLEAVRGAVDAGYGRVKLKIKPGDDVARVRSVRDAFPDLMIMLDANQSYAEKDLESLKALDELDIRCIEEPLDPTRLPKVGPTELFARLARLQKELQTPLCLDESIKSAVDLQRALAIPELRCYALKIAKWGGVQPALDFYHEARERGIELWMGGMYETGVSKYMHAAFETLPGISIPGDLASSSRYFAHDICNPPFEGEEGSIVLNRSGHEGGLGCDLDYEALKKVLVGSRTYRRASASEGENG